jgi:hypothetical protein
VLIAFFKFEAICDLLDRITVEINFEFVHPFRMVAGRRDGSEDGVADVDDKNGAGLATEYVQIRDVETDILASDG